MKPISRSSKTVQRVVCWVVCFVYGRMNIGKKQWRIVTVAIQAAILFTMKEGFKNSSDISCQIWFVIYPQRLTSDQKPWKELCEAYDRPSSFVNISVPEDTQKDMDKLQELTCGFLTNFLSFGLIVFCTLLKL